MRCNRTCCLLVLALVATLGPPVEGQDGGRVTTIGRLASVSVFEPSGTPLSAAQVPSVTLTQCRRSCDIALELDNEYGDESGPGMLDLVGFVKAYRDVSGRTYIVGEPIDNILVFDSEGSFLRRIGRSGSGPGELTDGGSFVVTGDGEFSVLDRGRGVILNYDHTGRLLSEARTQGWVPIGNRTYAWDRPWVVHVAELYTPDQVGFPLHLVNVETGEIDRSFGSATGERQLGGRGGLNPIAVRDDRRFWMVAGFERYDIGLWDMNQPQRLLRREADWFPELTQEDLTHGGPTETKPPAPFIYELALGDSVLWVLGTVADARWRQASEQGSSASGDEFYDDVLEVIDVRTNEVLATQRLDASHHLMGPGLLGRLEVDADGTVRYRVYRAQPRKWEG